MKSKIIYRTSYNMISYRISQFTNNDCIVEYNLAGWRAVENDADCAQIYMMAFLEERKKNINGC